MTVTALRCGSVFGELLSEQAQRIRALHSTRVPIYWLDRRNMIEMHFLRRLRFECFERISAGFSHGAGGIRAMSQLH